MLKYRLVSGSTLIGLFSIISFWKSTISSILFILVSCLFLSLALIEFFDLCRRMGFQGYPFQTILAGVLFFLSISVSSLFGVSYIYKIPSETGFYLIFIGILIIFVLFERDFRKGFLNFLVSLGGFFFIAWTTSFLIKIYFSLEGLIVRGNLHIFYLIMVTKSADIGGYTFGKISAGFPKGNRKIVPHISPGKSWEGLFGGILFSIMTSCLLVYYLNIHFSSSGHQNYTYFLAMVIGILLTILGLIGDLSISVLKRASNVKDSGARIPGMGGILDVMDSLLLVPPFYFCLLKVLDQFM